MITYLVSFQWQSVRENGFGDVRVAMGHPIREEDLPDLRSFLKGTVASKHDLGVESVVILGWETLSEGPRAHLPKTEVILIRERLWESWGKDAVTFGGLCAALWFVHVHLAGAWWAALGMWILFALWIFAKRPRKYTLDEAIDKLEEMVKKEENQ